MAELTEGQITDVIGVNDIVIKGDTSQDGTPTPSAPVDVNVVSGSNVIDMQNSNTNFAKDPVLIGYNVNDDGISIVPNFSVSQKIFINNNTNFYYGLIENFSVGDPNLRIGFFDENDNFLSRIVKNDISASSIKYVTIPSNAKYIRVGAKNELWNKINKVYYGFSNTIIPHQGKELPLDLPVENLFDKNNAEKYTGFTNGSDYKVAYNTATKSIIIPCKENTIYTVSKIKGGNYDRFNIASFTTKPTTGTIASKYVGDNSLTSLTITTGPNDAYIMVLYYHTSEMVYSENDILDSIQIEQGSKANAYTPYGTDPIELCKIGDYQDYFYKSGSKWYLHKGIKKLTGNDIISTSTFTESSTYSDSTYLCCYNNGFQSATYLNTRAYCNKFDGQYHYGENKVANNIRMGDSSLGICVLKSDFATVNDLNSYFNTNGNDIFVYMVLKTPTNTEITNTTLISQLEAIYNAPLYEQTNITQTNNDLPMVLDITAYKDNINGIKVFIRNSVQASLTKADNSILVTETVSGTTPTITAENNHLYICGEVETLDFTPSATGICNVIFESGDTATVLTLPQTVKMPEWFIVQPNTTYEISILNGVYGAVMLWS